MRLDKISSMYFIGIGGIGMSALAKHFHARGLAISGFDRTPSEMTRELTALGIDIHFEEDTSRFGTLPDLAVYTPAVPESNAELAYLRSKDIPVLKRSELLEEVTRDYDIVAVAGTHGKTTVTTMITYLLRCGGIDCTAFLGGVALNYGDNYVAGNSDWLVVEADEYDRSFLRLHPRIGVITAVDPDHLDIYGNLEAVDEAFRSFAAQVDSDGDLLVRHGLRWLSHFDLRPYRTYATQEGASAWISRYKTDRSGSSFDFCDEAGEIRGLQTQFPGLHNAENFTAAISVARMLGVSEPAIRNGVGSFAGIKRRFERVLDNGDLVYIDDYAHHPAEITALISAVRAQYSGKRITLVFQPHLYSRTRDLADGFAASLDLADEIIILPVYPAREEPIAGVNAGMILKKMRHSDKWILSKSDLLDRLKKLKPQVLLTVGAGDIDQLVEPIKVLLTNGNDRHGPEK